MAAQRARTGRPGLRERQKRDRERRILRAAELLFARRGYARTTMAQVARRAGLAVGTIYNYFPSKAEIVLALLRRETGETLAAGEAVRKHPPADPARALLTLFDVYLDLVARHDRALLRELVAAAVAQPEPIARAGFELDLRLVGQLRELLEDLRAHGRLAPDLDPARAATTLYAVYATWLTLYASVDDLDFARFREEVRAGVALVVRGLLPPSARG
ncbi:MAG: helix-turn-helix domain-containing protein [Myxococcota bacterium]|nr:helix-turn-helix domain-containing protein [Myxococcota bacterium]